MRDDDADAPRGELEPDRVGGQEIDEHDPGDEEPAGEDDAAGDMGDLGGDKELEIDADDERAEIAGDDGPDALVHLRERAGEDQDHREREEDDREAEGGDGLENLLERVHGSPSPTEWMSRSKAGRSASTPLGGPAILKNQV